MWFIGVEVEQETSAPPPKKKSWIRPWAKICPFNTIIRKITKTTPATLKRLEVFAEKMDQTALFYQRNKKP